MGPYLIQLRKHRLFEPLSDCALGEVLSRPLLGLLREPKIELEGKLLLGGVVTIRESQTGARPCRHLTHSCCLVPFLREECERRFSYALPRSLSLWGQHRTPLRRTLLHLYRLSTKMNMFIYDGTGST